MNQVNFIGRIVREIQCKTINENHQVVNNSLAVPRKQRDKNGELAADFIPFVAWDQHASVLEKYCQKGQRIAIQGRMQSRSYTNSDNQPRQILECVVQEITLLDRVNQSHQQTPPQFSETPSDSDSLPFDTLVD
ncbi:single-stranded DNA-binding protein [Tuanshanicoccus lijuaniae]|uniref:single-stranded DNA-binding protein n=1 Tax=Aerococcaceae bacterium zg-1292 TaxID=2774330 RepID=UPI0019350653|nr:single-stranded DNA-binding protein [Aerococcaceae bacterium zg-1292]MBF6626819.1 single-stranded DNA-binding protein [Aerococcaceae bacterium zg-BR9]MBF6979267.1 single-stranded DNA-binding protein [Aerococcaceae bacterium zg-BR22]QQA36983.1 single-stranded DNA-binding protein [Aerococcaceae bacterium zg-1292]